MFYFPMCFMLVATITSLVMTILGKIKTIAGGAAVWGDWYVAIWSTALVVLAAILAVTAVKTLAEQAKEKKA